MNPTYLNEVKDLGYFNSEFVSRLKLLFKSVKLTTKSKSNSFLICLPIEEADLNFLGMILIPIDEHNQIEKSRVRFLSIYKIKEEDFHEVAYKYLNEIILNWLYYLNERSYLGLVS